MSGTVVSALKRHITGGTIQFECFCLSYACLCETAESQLCKQAVFYIKMDFGFF